MNETCGDNGPRTPAANTDWGYPYSPPITPIVNRHKRNPLFPPCQLLPTCCLFHLSPFGYPYVLDASDLTHLQALAHRSPFESPSLAPNSPRPNASPKPPTVEEATFPSVVNSLLLALLLRSAKVGNPSHATISRIPPPPRRQRSRRLSWGMF